VRKRTCALDKLLLETLFDIAAMGERTRGKFENFRGNFGSRLEIQSKMDAHLLNSHCQIPKRNEGKEMRLETILNDCEKFKSFVYENSKFVRQNAEKILEIKVVPRKNGEIICSCCGNRASYYDQLATRRFEFVPFWGYPVFFIYQMRRVSCKNCGVKVEKVPWADGKQTLTKTYMIFLSEWAKKLSWKETARTFKTSWRKVFESVKYAVNWGLLNRAISGVKSIGVDEFAWRCGHKYLTLVYQIDPDNVRLLWVGKNRTVKTLLRFFREFGKDWWSSKLRHVCSDMWKPYLKVIRKKAPQALHILDRFHIVKKLNDAIDEVRAGEHRKMQNEGYEPLLRNSRWCLLKRKENLTEKQEAKLKDLLKFNLKSIRAYLLKEDFNGLWEYVSAGWAGKFLDRWCTRAMRSKLDPIKKVAKTVRKHKPLILNWFKAKKAFSSGIVEGLNLNVNLATRKAYGFRSLECAKIALYHQLGRLPIPPTTHRFW
jgi:transposase